MWSSSLVSGADRPALSLQRSAYQVGQEHDGTDEGEQHSESDGQTAAVDPDSGPCLVPLEFGVAVTGNGRVLDEESSIVVDRPVLDDHAATS